MVPPRHWSVPPQCFQTAIDRGTSRSPVGRAGKRDAESSRGVVAGPVPRVQPSSTFADCQGAAVGRPPRGWNQMPPRRARSGPRRCRCAHVSLGPNGITRWWRCLQRRQLSGRSITCPDRAPFEFELSTGPGSLPSRQDRISAPHPVAEASRAGATSKPCRGRRPDGRRFPRCRRRTATLSPRPAHLASTATLPSPMQPRP